MHYNLLVEYGFLTNVADGMMALLGSYEPLVVYLSVFFLGENGVLAASMLSSQGYLLPPTVLLYAALGSLSADIFWYVITVSVLKRMYEKKSLKKETISEQKMFLLKVAEKHTFLFLTFIKFLIGMRLFLTIYILLKKHIPFTKYLLINCIGTVLFIGVLFPLGWLLGKGVSSALSVERGVVGVVSVVVVVIIIANFLPRLLAFIIARYSKKIGANEENKSAY